MVVGDLGNAVLFSSCLVYIVYAILLLRDWCLEEGNDLEVFSSAL